MRWITSGYVVVSVWIFGWLSAYFGVMAGCLAAVILASPVYFAGRILKRDRPAKWNEYCYLGILTVVAVGGTAFLVASWFDSGMDRCYLFEREYRAFRRHVVQRPEFRNVEITHTHAKGGMVYLRGTVASKSSHDRLISTIDEMVHYNECGYFDEVDYPGKPEGP